jgi:hypothetical protein
VNSDDGHREEYPLEEFQKILMQLRVVITGEYGLLYNGLRWIRGLLPSMQPRTFKCTTVLQYHCIEAQFHSILYSGVITLLPVLTGTGQHVFMVQ